MVGCRGDSFDKGTAPNYFGVDADYYSIIGTKNEREYEEKPEIPSYLIYPIELTSQDFKVLYDFAKPLHKKNRTKPKTHFLESPPMPTMEQYDRLFTRFDSTFVDYDLGARVRMSPRIPLGNPVPKANPMAPGYQSYGWTTQDWRSIKVNNKGEIDYSEKCGAEGTQTASGKPRLCLPAIVVKSLIRTESGKEVIRKQARKKARAKKGERIPWQHHESRNCGRSLKRRQSKTGQRRTEQRASRRIPPRDIKWEIRPHPDAEDEPDLEQSFLVGVVGGKDIIEVVFTDEEDKFHIDHIRIERDFRDKGYSRPTLDWFKQKGKPIELFAPIQSRGSGEKGPERLVQRDV